MNIDISIAEENFIIFLVIGFVIGAISFIINHLYKKLK